MFSLLAIFGVVGGLVLVPAAPPLGALLVIGGFASAGKAMDRPDDLPFALGIGIGAALVFAAVELVVFTADCLGYS